MSGYIKYHRSLHESCLWQALTPQGKVVLDTLLVNCSYKTTSIIIDGERRELQPGQWLTSLPTIQRKAGKGVSAQNIRTALNLMQSQQFIKQELTEGNKRIITIVNWDIYQNGNAPNSDLTGSQQETNRGLTDEQQRSNSILRSKEVKEGLKSNKKALNTFASDDSKSESPSPPPKEKIFYNPDTQLIENVSEQQIDIWSRTYPACDVNAEILKASAWQSANPKKLKKDYKRFLNTWMANCQERGGTRGYSPSNASAPTSPPKYVPETDVPQWVIDQYSHDPCKLYYIRDQWDFMGRRWDDINVKVYITEEMREWWRKSKHNPENQVKDK